MKNSRAIYSLSFIAIMFCSVLSFVILDKTSNMRFGIKSAKDLEKVSLSHTYAQIGEGEYEDKLRFVTAIDMSNENVEKVNYTKIADFATTTTVEKEVTSLYKSVAGSEDTVYYYDGSKFVNSNPENGYYFASYVVAYKSSANKANLFTVAMDVNDDAAKVPFLTTSYNAIAAGKDANATASFVVDCELLWFAEGFVVYKFPNEMKKNRHVKEVSVSMELCSEAIYYREKYLSDITIFINNVEMTTWTSPCDFGGRRGTFSPHYWSLNSTQFGMLKNFKVNKRGVFIDDILVNPNINISHLRIHSRNDIKLTIKIKDDAIHKGGINIFGKNFGDHNQAIVLKIK